MKKICEQCGIEYDCRPARAHISRFHSVRCRCDWEKIHGRITLTDAERKKRKKDPQATYTCIGCGKKFQASTYKPRKYHSRECSAKHIGSKPTNSWNKEKQEIDMTDRRSLRLKVRRNQLSELLNLADGIQIVQITVGNDGEIDFLLEAEDFPVSSIRGKVPDIALDSIQYGTIQTYGDSCPIQITKPQTEAASTGRSTSAIYCEHANEMPVICPCPDDCYCKDHSCKGRYTSKFSEEVRRTD